MKIQTGNPVRGSEFFIRENLIEQAWDYIKSGNHILIAAPRRMGKTSLMYYLLDHPKEGFSFLYLDTESINNENEFFRRIVNKVLKTDYVKGFKKLWAFIEKHKPSITKVGPDGVEFGVSDKHDYFEMLKGIIASISSDGRKLVIMLDEFPETLENIVNDEGESAGIHFLQSNRELRHDPALDNRVQFIYTGSIGLENIAGKLNAIKAINDLSGLKIPPLKEKEAKKLIFLLLENLPFVLSESIVNLILKKIEWLIPFYIQLVIDELKNLHRDGDLPEISKSDLDKAFDNMLGQRHHFEHWHTRLRSSLKGNDYNFVKEILNVISEKDTINSNEVVNLAVKYQLLETYKDLVGSLVYDGYINNHDEHHIYRFNTPILKMWWRKNVAN